MGYNVFKYRWKFSNLKPVAIYQDSIMFVGIKDFLGGGGVYRSFDSGETWEFSGLYNKFISSLAINSQGVIYAGSIGDYVYGVGGLYRSSNFGDTWEVIRNDIFVETIIIDSNDEIYIGCTNEYGTQGGVFRSFDYGASWELINTGLSTYKIYGLHASYDGYLYAFGDHLHRSAEPVFTPKAAISAVPNPEGAGLISGQGFYFTDKTAILKAKPKTGYSFIYWTEDGYKISSEPIYSFEVSEDRHLVANFLELEQFTISTSINPENSGSVEGAGCYYESENAKLIAMPAQGFAFENWTEGDDVVAETETYSFDVTQNRTLSANFQLINIIANDNINTITFFPNPFIDIINIQIPENYISGSLMEIEIYNSMGLLVYNKNMPVQQNIQLYLKGLNPAIYTLIINMEGRQITERIIKL